MAKSLASEPESRGATPVSSNTSKNRKPSKADGWMCSYANRQLVPCGKSAEVVIEVGLLMKGACWRHRLLVERSMVHKPIWHWLTA